LKIVRPLGHDQCWLTLAAVDDAGDLLIRVELATWEQMQASGSDWMDAEDRHDLALSLVETRAARIEPAGSPQGRLVTLR
jgi:hypothetical protein